MILVLSYLLWLLTLVLVFRFSLKSKNNFLMVFGFIYFLYSLGFLSIKFDFIYFYKYITVDLDAYHYSLISIINIILVGIIYLDSRASFKVLHIGNRIIQLVSYLFICMALVAIINDINFYGFEKFIYTPKTEKYVTTDVPLNLFFISINYYLFLIAGLYSIYSQSNDRKNRRLIFILMLFISLISLVQGYRYVLVTLFILIFLEIYAKRKIKIHTVLLLVPVALFFAEFIKVLGSYIFFYEWVSQDGFVKYLINDYETNGFTLFPSEILAITTNTYVGLSNLDKFAPDISGYILKLIPFSEKFYDFSNFNNFYSSIATILNLDLTSGQGTAFSFILENYTSYFFPSLALAIVSILWRLYKSPILLVLSINFALNLIRNGLLISINELKIPLLIYFSIVLSLQFIDISVRNKTLKQVIKSPIKN